MQTTKLLKCGSQRINTRKPLRSLNVRLKDPKALNHRAYVSAAFSEKAYFKKSFGADDFCTLCAKPQKLMVYERTFFSISHTPFNSNNKGVKVCVTGVRFMAVQNDDEATQASLTREQQSQQQGVDATQNPNEPSLQSRGEQDNPKRSWFTWMPFYQKSKTKSAEALVAKTYANQLQKLTKKNPQLLAGRLKCIVKPDDLVRGRAVFYTQYHVPLITFVQAYTEIYGKPKSMALDADEANYLHTLSNCYMVGFNTDSETILNNAEETLTASITPIQTQRLHMTKQFNEVLGTLINFQSQIYARLLDDLRKTEEFQVWIKDKPAFQKNLIETLGPIESQDLDSNEKIIKPILDPSKLDTLLRQVNQSHLLEQWTRNQAHVCYMVGVMAFETAMLRTSNPRYKQVESVDHDVSKINLSLLCQCNFVPYYDFKTKQADFEIFADGSLVRLDNKVWKEEQMSEKKAKALVGYVTKLMEADGSNVGASELEFFHYLNRYHRNDLVLTNACLMTKYDLTPSPSEAAEFYRTIGLMCSRPSLLEPLAKKAFVYNQICVLKSCFEKQSNLLATDNPSTVIPSVTELRMRVQDFESIKQLHSGRDSRTSNDLLKKKANEISKRFKYALVEKNSYPKQQPQPQKVKHMENICKRLLVSTDALKSLLEKAEQLNPTDLNYNQISSEITEAKSKLLEFSNQSSNMLHLQRCCALLTAFEHHFSGVEKLVEAHHREKLANVKQSVESCIAKPQHIEPLKVKEDLMSEIKHLENAVHDLTGKVVPKPQPHGANNDQCPKPEKVIESLKLSESYRGFLYDALRLITYERFFVRQCLEHMNSTDAFESWEMPIAPMFMIPFLQDQSIVSKGLFDHHVQKQTSRSLTPEEKVKCETFVKDLIEMCETLTHLGEFYVQLVLNRMIEDNFETFDKSQLENHLKSKFDYLLALDACVNGIQKPLQQLHDALQNFQSAANPSTSEFERKSRLQRNKAITNAAKIVDHWLYVLNHDDDQMHKPKPLLFSTWVNDRRRVLNADQTAAFKVLKLNQSDFLSMPQDPERIWLSLPKFLEHVVYNVQNLGQTSDRFSSDSKAFDVFMHANALKALEESIDDDFLNAHGIKRPQTAEQTMATAVEKGLNEKLDLVLEASKVSVVTMDNVTMFKESFEHLFKCKKDFTNLQNNLEPFTRYEAHDKAEAQKSVYERGHKRFKFWQVANHALQHLETKLNDQNTNFERQLNLALDVSGAKRSEQAACNALYAMMAICYGHIAKLCFSKVTAVDIKTLFETVENQIQQDSFSIEHLQKYADPCRTINAEEVLSKFATMKLDAVINSRIKHHNALSVVLTMLHTGSSASTSSASTSSASTSSRGLSSKAYDFSKLKQTLEACQSSIDHLKPYKSTLENLKCKLDELRTQCEDKPQTKRQAAADEARASVSACAPLEQLIQQLSDEMKGLEAKATEQEQAKKLTELKFKVHELRKSTFDLMTKWRNVEEVSKEKQIETDMQKLLNFFMSSYKSRAEGQQGQRQQGQRQQGEDKPNILLADRGGLKYLVHSETEWLFNDEMLLNQISDVNLWNLSNPSEEQPLSNNFEHMYPLACLFAYKTLVRLCPIPEAQKEAPFNALKTLKKTPVLANIAEDNALDDFIVNQNNVLVQNLAESKGDIISASEVLQNTRNEIAKLSGSLADHKKDLEKQVAIATSKETRVVRFQRLFCQLQQSEAKVEDDLKSACGTVEDKQKDFRAAENNYNAAFDQLNNQQLFNTVKEVLLFEQQLKEKNAELETLLNDFKAQVGDSNADNADNAEASNGSDHEDLV